MAKFKPALDKLRSIFKIGTPIYWFNYDNRRICGHAGRPRVGDVVTAKMSSGKIGVYEIIKVDWCSDPSNMYFADVRDVGYWEKFDEA